MGVERTPAQEVVELAESVGTDGDRSRHMMRALALEIRNHSAQIASLAASMQVHENTDSDRHREVKELIARVQDRVSETFDQVRGLRGDIQVYEGSLQHVRSMAIEAEEVAGTARDEVRNIQANYSNPFPSEQETRRHGFPRPMTPAVGFVLPMRAAEPSRPDMTSERVRRIQGEEIERRVGRNSLSLVWIVLGAVASGLAGAIVHAVLGMAR